VRFLASRERPPDGIDPAEQRLPGLSKIPALDERRRVGELRIRIPDEHCEARGRALSYWSVAVQFTVVDSIGNCVPDAGVQTSAGAENPE